MARPSWLVRVVTDFGSLLPTVDCLDGCINVEHPRLIEQWLPYRTKLSLLPVTLYPVPPQVLQILYSPFHSPHCKRRAPNKFTVSVSRTSYGKLLIGDTHWSALS